MHILHTWSAWEAMQQQSWSNAFGHLGVGMFQVRVCITCNKVKWRKV